MAVDSDGDYVDDPPRRTNNNTSLSSPSLSPSTDGNYDDSDDGIFDDDDDENDPDMNMSGVRSGGGAGTARRKRPASKSKGRGRAKWEGAVQPGQSQQQKQQEDGGRGERGGKQRRKGAGVVDFGVGIEAVREAAAGERIADSVEGMIEARKRKRVEQRDTTPLQRGIIRHVLLVLDLSEAMLDKDMRPSRYLVAIRYAQEYVREFFEQNPISQLGILAMHDGVCIRVSDLGGNPGEHVAALASLRDDPRTSRQPKGSPSLQNALEMARASLFHTPAHGTREVVLVLGALVSLDPDDIHRTIEACVRDRLRVAIIGMSARLKICQEICARTSGGGGGAGGGKKDYGDDSSYTVALDQQHFRELLMATTTPPVIRSDARTSGTAAANGTEKQSRTPAQPTSLSSLLMMGFPSRTTETAPSICACHGNIQRGGYPCSRCGAKVCSLPATCPACGLTLILSTHLARSYHHLFPLRGWVEVSWERALQVGSVECKGCLTRLAEVPRAVKVAVAKKKKKRMRRRKEKKKRMMLLKKAREKLDGVDGDVGVEEGKAGVVVGGDGEEEVDDEDEDEDEDVAALPVKVEGASESSRYECESCQQHFCVDCDVFCHEVVHNCPGCLSMASAGAAGTAAGAETGAEAGAKTDAMAVDGNGGVTERPRQQQGVEQGVEQNGGRDVDAMDIG